MRRTITTTLAGITLAALFLSISGPAIADHKPKHNPPGHSKGQRDAKNGPPAWAPAWGYRGKEKLRYRHQSRDIEIDAAKLVTVSPSGFGTCNRDVIGAALGSAAGAVAGAQFGKGDGKTLATVGGAIIGALVGGNIGRVMDQTDQNCVGQILERAPNDSAVAWRDPDTNRQYQVTPTRTYEECRNTVCREYHTQIVIDGNLENAYGSACRKPDGSWEKR